jgi:hypothetical protein
MTNEQLLNKIDEIKEKIKNIQDLKSEINSNIFESLIRELMQKQYFLEQKVEINFKTQL